jgi:hypothetical protein
LQNRVIPPLAGLLSFFAGHPRVWSDEQLPAREEGDSRSDAANSRFVGHGNCPTIIGGKRGVGQSTELGRSRSRRGWLDADVIIDGIAEPLFAAKIPFSCLDAHVTEQELDLFKLPAGLVTEARTGSTQIVKGNAIKAAF